VAAVFVDSDAVNAVLRVLIDIARASAASNPVFAWKKSLIIAIFLPIIELLLTGIALLSAGVALLLVRTVKFPARITLLKGFAASFLPCPQTLRVCQPSRSAIAVQGRLFGQQPFQGWKSVPGNLLLALKGFVPFSRALEGMVWKTACLTATTARFRRKLQTTLPQNKP